MYRALVMFPTSTSPAEVDALIQGIASSLTTSTGFETMTRSAGALMGPGAKAGQVGSILEADFSTLDDVMAALQSESFQEVKAATKSAGTTILLFEVTTV